MSTETSLFCNIYFVGASYNYLWEVEQEIRKLGKYCEKCKQELRDLVMMTEPQNTSRRAMKTAVCMSK